MAYPQSLFMQREDELPDPNVDPIGYAEAVARLEKKRKSGGPKKELAPQDLDPLDAAAAPLPMDPVVGDVPAANIPAPDMVAPMDAPVAPMEEVAATPSRPDRNDHVARAMRIHGPNWGRFVAQAQLGGGRRTPQSVAAEALLNDMNPEWRQLANFFMLTGGPGKATTPMDVQMQQAQLQNQMAMMQERNRGNLDVANVNAGAEVQVAQGNRDFQGGLVDKQQNFALKKMEIEATEGDKDRKARKEAAKDKLDGDLALLERGSALKNPAEDSRLTDAKAAAAQEQVRAANPTAAGIEDLVAGKFTPQALAELKRLGDLYDSGNETSGALWWADYLGMQGIGGMSDQDEGNLRQYLIGLGVPEGVAAQAARQTADERRILSGKRGPLPPGAARPRT